MIKITAGLALAMSTAAVPQPSRRRLAAMSLRSDAEFVKSLVSTTGIALRYAAAEVQADRRIVLAAISQDWRALQHVVARCLDGSAPRADREVFANAALSQPGGIGALTWADVALCDEILGNYLDGLDIATT